MYLSDNLVAHIAPKYFVKSYIHKIYVQPNLIQEIVIYRLVNLCKRPNNLI